MVQPTSARDAPLDPALRFRTFGGALLEGRDGIVTGAGSQRRRLAVLALLAANGPGLSRDRLIGLLWPESTEERARHSLAQLLHAIRRELGEAVVVGSATTLRLNPGVLPTDVQEFSSAIEARDLALAVDLYRGAFLDGFYLNGCSDFEHWVEERRATFARQAEGALEALAERATANGDVRVATELWQRLAILRPLDSRVALAFVRAIAATGDRARALQRAHDHIAILHDELGAAAPVEFVTETEALRAKPTTLSLTLDRGAARSAMHPATDALTATIGGTPPALPQLPRSSQPAQQSHPRAVRARVGVAAIFVGAIAALVAFGPRGSSDPTSNTPRQLIIADAENSTGETVFDRTIPVALAAALAQSPRVEVMSPDRVAHTLERMRRTSVEQPIDERTAREIARRSGVSIVTVPAISRAGDGYELTARVLDGTSGAVLGFASARADRRSDVLGALDRLGKRLRSDLGESSRSIRANAIPLPLVTTRSLDALEKFADGVQALRTGHATIAESLWTQAVRIDSTFAIAYANLGMARFRSGHPAAGAAYYARAVRHLDSLPEREQVVIRASAKSGQGDHTGAAQSLATFLVAHPTDPMILRMIGYEYFRMGDPADGLDAFSRLLVIDSTDYSVWINVAGVHGQLGQTREAIRAYHRAFALEPEQLTANDNLNLEFARAFVLTGQTDSAAAIISALASQPDPQRHARALRSMAFLASLDGRYDEASDDIAHAIALTHTGPTSAVTDIRNHLLLATMLDDRGRTVEAAKQRDSADLALAHGDADPTLAYWLGKALARAGDVSRAARVLARLEAKPNPTSPTYRAAIEALRAEVLIGQHRVTDGLSHLRLAMRDDSTAIVRESLAYGNAVAGNVDEAAAQYEQLGRGNGFGWEGQYVWRAAPYLQGRVLERAGRSEPAQIAYEKFLNAWPHADADLRSVADARERLARLRARGPSD